MRYFAQCNASGITVDDLIQHAYITLYNAVQGYKQGEVLFISYYGKAMKHGFLRLVFGQDKSLSYSVSFDVPLDDEDSNSDTLADVTPDPDAENTIDDVAERDYQRALSADINTALSMIPDDEQNVIRKRFWGNLNLTETAAECEITYTQVRSLEGKALNRLRSGNRIVLLRKYRNDVINGYAYHGTYALWKSTGTSSKEYTV